MVPSMGNRRRGQNTPTRHLWVVSKKGLKLHEAERDAAAAGPAPAGDSGAAAEKGRFTINRSGHGMGSAAVRTPFNRSAISLILK